MSARRPYGDRETRRQYAMIWVGGWEEGWACRYNGAGACHESLLALQEPNATLARGKITGRGLAEEAARRSGRQEGLALNGTQEAGFLGRCWYRGARSLGGVGFG